MFATYKLYFIGALLLAVAGGGWAFYTHYENLKAERDDYLVKMTTASQNLKYTKGAFTDYIVEAGKKKTENDKARAELQAAYRKEKERSDELAKMLSRHDFGMLTRRKPGLIELRVNRATERLFSNVEKITGGGTSDDDTPTNNDGAVSSARPGVNAYYKVGCSKRRGARTLYALYGDIRSGVMFGTQVLRKPWYQHVRHSSRNYPAERLDFEI